MEASSHFSSFESSAGDFEAPRVSSPEQSASPEKKKQEKEVGSIEYYCTILGAVSSLPIADRKNAILDAIRRHAGELLESGFLTDADQKRLALVVEDADHAFAEASQSR